MKCEKCKHNCFHGADSFLTVSERGGDPYNYNFCEMGHWSGDIFDMTGPTEKDPWADCGDYIEVINDD